VLGRAEQTNLGRPRRVRANKSRRCSPPNYERQKSNLRPSRFGRTKYVKYAHTTRPSRDREGGSPSVHDLFKLSRKQSGGVIQIPEVTKIATTIINAYSLNDMRPFRMPFTLGAFCMTPGRTSGRHGGEAPGKPWSDFERSPRKERHMINHLPRLC
jgi:hypothetical protein